MEKIIYGREFFNIEDTLTCGQTFRFKPFDRGYKVFSADKCAYVFSDGTYTIIQCENGDVDYFYNYFDLKTDYSEIVKRAKSHCIEAISQSAESGKGIRILRQDLYEVAVSFIISQNNNIPRIKSIIERLCEELGERKVFAGDKYFAFPSAERMSAESIDFFKKMGLGYRAEYVKEFSSAVAGGLNLSDLSALCTVDLMAKLISMYGIGPKVANCIALFGYKRTDSFPVDTWIEKVYKNDLHGLLTDRKKISAELVDKFKSDAGYIQQYLFHYKRNNSDKI